MQLTVNTVFFCLAFSLFMLIVLIVALRKEKNRNEMNKEFVIFNSLLCVHLLGVMLQILFSKSNIPPIYFEYIAYIGGMFMPVTFLRIAIIYNKKKINIKKFDFLYYICAIFLVLLWTNDFHNLFYATYSTNFSETVYGPILIAFAVFSYTLLITAMFMIAVTSVKRTGLFSAQAITMIVAILVPVVGNIIGFAGIVESSVYVTPILYSIMALCLYIAIFQLKALNVIPVTTKTIINTMSDSFVVISDDGTIVDVNSTFVKTFASVKKVNNNDNLFELVKQTNIFNVDEFHKLIKLSREKHQNIIRELHITRNDYEKYFEIEIQPILARDKSEYVATLVMMRDITTAKKDMEMFVKNENLVILGELAGGVAHDINTPISAIKSGILMLRQSEKNEDEKMLLASMDSCADKIIALTNSLRNQIRNIGSNEASDVNISTVIKDIQLILSNEFKKRKVTFSLNIKEEIHIMGYATKLSQVLTNIITNAIQAYEGKEGKIEVTVEKDKEQKAVNIIIEDWAGGIPESVRPYIFKNILTTKGVSGTGFGLYLAYSIVKGAFGGEIAFDTLTGKGTRFVVTLPLINE